MNILFVHQNFPGQYRELFKWIVARKRHQVVFLTQRRDAPAVEGARIVTYRPHHSAADDAYALTSYWEDCVGNGYGVALACEALQAEGFRPDVILGHIGWGELTFVKQVWPDIPVLGFFEYFFLDQGGLVGFDPEFPSSDRVRYTMHARNAVNFANIQTVDLGQTPTEWQKSTFPESFHHKFYVCHEGIRTDILRPTPNASVALGRLTWPVNRSDEIVTYVARNLEPARGFHVFMRALPEILDNRPEARAVIIGGSEASYSHRSDRNGGYRAMMEREVGDKLDWDRVHFVGRVPYSAFLRIIQISRCHIYLTAPFVPSWSLLEAMSMGATVVASDVPPVRELVTHGKTGLLVDFFDPSALAQQVVECLSNPDQFTEIGTEARRYVVENFDFHKQTLPVHLDKICSLAQTGESFAIG